MTPQFYESYGGAEARADHRHDLVGYHQLLAGRAGARLINVERLWKRVRPANTAIPLTEDGNHPTVAGSCLYALAVCATLSQQTVSRVGYAPRDLSAADAATFRQTVDDSGLAGFA